MKLLRKQKVDDFLDDDNADNTESYNMGARSEESYNDDQDDEHDDDEDDYGAGKKKRRGAKKNSTGTTRAKKSQKPPKDGSKSKWENAFDENGRDPSEPKPERKKRVPKPKVAQNPNLVKTQNKLIGEIINTELYAQEDDDDDLLHIENRDKLFNNAQSTGMEMRREELDLGMG